VKFFDFPVDAPSSTRGAGAAGSWPGRTPTPPRWLDPEHDAVCTCKSHLDLHFPTAAELQGPAESTYFYPKYNEYSNSWWYIAHRL
jgi:hypothetical protein